MFWRSLEDSIDDLVLLKGQRTITTPGFVAKGGYIIFTFDKPSSQSFHWKLVLFSILFKYVWR